MRVLAVTQPVPSHFQTLVSFAHALEGAGHAVAVASGASLGPVIAEAGFTNVPCGLSVPDQWHELLPELEGASAEEFDRIASGYFFFGPGLTRMIDDLIALCREWRPDLLLHEQFAFAAPFVGELLAIPYASVGGGYRSEDEVPFTALVSSQSAARTTSHLIPPAMRSAAISPSTPGRVALRLLTQSRSQSAIPIDASPFNWSNQYPLPAWFATLPGRPIVHATLGTTFAEYTHDLYATILAGLRDEPYSLIVTVGNSVDPATFGPQPENVYIERYISHAALLPKCAALLTHGGLGTILAAFDCGLPFLAVPITADQPDNAAQCAATGVSRLFLQLN